VSFLGLFDKKQPTQADATGGVVTDTTVTAVGDDVTGKPVAEESVDPSLVSTVSQKPVVTQPLGSTPNVGGSNLTDDYSKASISQVPEVEEEKTVSPKVDESPTLSVTEPVSPFGGSMEDNSPGGSSSFSLDEETQAPEAPVTPSFGKQSSVSDTSNDEDASEGGSVGSGLSG